MGPNFPVPDRALVAGRDSTMCEGTLCGKDIYVSAADVDGVTVSGKTWFPRDDGSCASVAFLDSVRVLFGVQGGVVENGGLISHMSGESVNGSLMSSPRNGSCFAWCCPIRLEGSIGSG